MKIPEGYTCERWPWGGYMTFQKGYDSWLIMERGDSRYKAIKNLNEHLQKLKDGWKQVWEDNTRLVWIPPKNRRVAQ